MKKYIVTILLLLYLNTCFANKILDTQINFFLGKQYFAEKQFTQANHFFNKIISENNIFNIYVQQAYIYTHIIYFKQKHYNLGLIKLARFEIITGNIINKYSDYNAALAVLFTLQINIKKLAYKTKNYLNKYNYKYYLTKNMLSQHNNIPAINLKLVHVNKIIKHNYLYKKLNCALYYITKESYTLALKKLNYTNNTIPKTYYDFIQLSLILKIYNELFLSNYTNIIINETIDNIKEYKKNN